MALINCPECNTKVSDKAGICPKCGYPIAEYLDEIENEREINTRKEKYYSKTEFNFLGEKFEFDKNERLCALIEAVFCREAQELCERLSKENDEKIFNYDNGINEGWALAKVEEYYRAIYDNLCADISGIYDVVDINLECYGYYDEGDVKSSDFVKETLAGFLSKRIDFYEIGIQLQDISEGCFSEYEYVIRNAFSKYDERVNSISDPYRPINAVYSSSITGLVGASLKAAVINGITGTITGMAGEAIRNQASKNLDKSINEAYQVALKCSRKRISALKDKVLRDLNSYKELVYDFISSCGCDETIFFIRKDFKIMRPYKRSKELENRFQCAGINDKSNREIALKIIQDNPAGFEMYDLIFNGIAWKKEELVSFVQFVQFFMSKKNIKDIFGNNSDETKLLECEDINEHLIEEYILKQLAKAERYKKEEEKKRLEEEKKKLEEEKKAKSEKENDLFIKLEKAIDNASDSELIANYRTLLIIYKNPDTLNVSKFIELINRYEDLILHRVDSSIKWNDEEELDSVFGILLQLKKPVIESHEEEWKYFISIYDLLKNEYLSEFYKNSYGFIKQLLYNNKYDKKTKVYSLKEARLHEGDEYIAFINGLLDSDELVILRIDLFDFFLICTTKSFYVVTNNDAYRFQYEGIARLYIGIDKEVGSIKYELLGTEDWDIERYDGNGNKNNLELALLFAEYLKKYITDPEIVVVDYNYVDDDKRTIVEEEKKRLEEIRREKELEEKRKKEIDDAEKERQWANYEAKRRKEKGGCLLPIIAFVVVCVIIGGIFVYLGKNNVKAPDSSSEENVTQEQTVPTEDALPLAEDNDSEKVTTAAEEMVVVTNTTTVESNTVKENTTTTTDESQDEDSSDESTEETDDSETVDDAEMTGIDNSYLSGRYRERVDENVSIMYVDMYDDFAEGHPCGTVRIEYDDSSIVTGDFIYSSTWCFYSELYCDGKDLGNYYITFDLYCNPAVVHVFYDYGPKVTDYELDE